MVCTVCLSLGDAVMTGFRASGRLRTQEPRAPRIAISLELCYRSFVCVAGVKAMMLTFLWYAVCVHNDRTGVFP